MKQVTKNDLIKILVETYGYEKNDLKDSDGKPYTNAKLQGMIKAEESDAKEAEKEVTRVLAPATKIKDSDLIVFMNGRSDTVIYHSEKTGRSWQLNKFGDRDSMEYGELKTMNYRHPRFIEEGWFIILDRAVQEELKLTEKYENILTPDNVDKIFSLDIESLDLFIDALPEGQKLSFVNLAQEKVANGTLDSIQVSNFIQEKFKFRFEDNAPIEDTILSSEKVGLANIIIVDKI